MITRFSIKNFKALRDITLDLTPRHVLIGPNDTGKTSILQALYGFCQLDTIAPALGFPSPYEELPTKGTSLAQFILDGEVETCKHSVACKRVYRTRSEKVTIVDESYRLGVEPNMIRRPQLSADETRAITMSAQMYRWNPRHLALPVQLRANRKFRMNQGGFGLAACLDDILSYDYSRYGELEKRFVSLFPHFKRIRLVTEAAYDVPDADDPQVVPSRSGEGKGIYFELHDATSLVPASVASDGALLVLAYLAILFMPEPPNLLLIEEPENGIHPSRLAEVLTILRQLVGEQRHTQVIMTTHSPYVLDHFKPEEVTLCRRTEQGDVAVKRLSDSKRVREQLDVFTLGEIWTSEGDEAIAAS